MPAICIQKYVHRYDKSYIHARGVWQGRQICHTVVTFLNEYVMKGFRRSSFHLFLKYIFNLNGKDCVQTVNESCLNKYIYIFSITLKLQAYSTVDIVSIRVVLPYILYMHILEIRIFATRKFQICITFSRQ